MTNDLHKRKKEKTKKHNTHSSGVLLFRFLWRLKIFINLNKRKTVSLIIIIFLLFWKCLTERYSYAMGDDVNVSNENATKITRNETNVGAIFLSLLCGAMCFSYVCVVQMDESSRRLPDRRRPKATIHLSAARREPPTYGAG